MSVCVLGQVDVWQNDGDRCDKCADVPVISDTPSSLRVEERGGEGGQGRGDGLCYMGYHKYGRDSICKQGKR